MNFVNRVILLSAILIISFASVKCCIQSKNLIDFGMKILGAVNEVYFNNYYGIEDIKDSVKFAIDSSNVATSERIHNLLHSTSIPSRDQHILNATKHVEHHFNTLFSLLTPLDGYDVKDMESAVKNVSTNDLMHSSIALMQQVFADRKGLREVVEALKQESYEHHCNSTMSHHQRIVGLYNRALFNIIMGFASLIYNSKQSYRIQSQLNTNVTPNYLIKTYKRLTSQPKKKIHSIMKDLSRVIHRCDPYEYEHEKTYDRLYELVESYLTSERFLTDNGQCTTSPMNYDGVKHPDEIHNYIDESLVCYGTLYKCVKVDLKHIFLYGNDYIYRRYHAYSLGDKSSPDGEKLYGEIGDATIAYTKDELNGIYVNGTKVVDPTITNSVVADTENCSIYRCLCDSHDSPRTTRYFSTKLVTADKSKNEVITGLRLTIIDRVVYIQIQTGILKGVEAVDPMTVKWNDIEKVNIENVDEYSPDAEFVALNYHNRTLYLDDISTFKGYYLTGVQFVRAMRGVRIAGEFTSYVDPKNVKTYLSMSHPENTNRTELQVDTNVPLSMIELGSKPISIQNEHFIKFQPSNMKTDAGQTTVPFLDIQPVISDPPLALSGFGIYYKGRRNFGGFVALKLISSKFL